MNLCEILDTNEKHLVQKVHTFDETKIRYPCIVQEKFDGVYCIAVLLHDEVHIYSRTGKEYFSLDHLKTNIHHILNWLGCTVLIFEAYLDNSSLNIISGKVRKNKPAIDIIGIIHDNLNWMEYFGCVPRDYKTRFYRLKEYFEYNHINNLRIPKQYNCITLDEIKNIANEIWQRGGEGVVIKNPDAPYMRGKRTCDLMKLKRGVSYDLEVIGVKEGLGKYAGAIGALVCRYRDGTITIGTGICDTERFAWYKNPKLILHKIVQIDAMSESARGVLREPAYKCVREDKHSADF